MSSRISYGNFLLVSPLSAAALPTPSKGPIAPIPRHTCFHWDSLTKTNRDTLPTHLYDFHTDLNDTPEPLIDLHGETVWHLRV